MIATWPLRSTTKVSRRLALVVAITAVNVVISPLSAAPAPGWSQALSVSPRGGVSNPSVTIDGAGNTVVVWTSDGFVHASERSVVTGAWGAPVTLSGPSGSVFGARVVVDAQGTAVAVWTVNKMPGAAVMAATRVARTWQPPVEILSGPGPGGSANVAMNMRGDAVVTWGVLLSVGRTTVRAVIRDGVTDTWSPPADFGSATAFDVTPRVAIDPRGNAVIAWNATTRALRAVFLDAASRSWDAPAQLSRRGREISANPRVAIDLRGRAVVTWADDRPAEDPSVPAAVLASTRSFDSRAWTAPIRIGAGTEPDVATDPAGGATATWAATPGIASASLTAAGFWGAAVPVSRSSGDARIAIDAQGNALAVWSSTIPSGYMALKAAFRPAGATSWQATTRLAAATVFVTDWSTATGPRGSAAVAWIASDGAKQVATVAVRPLADASIPPPLPCDVAGFPAPAMAECPEDPLASARALWLAVGLTYRTAPGVVLRSRRGRVTRYRLRNGAAVAWDSVDRKGNREHNDRRGRYLRMRGARCWTRRASLPAFPLIDVGDANLRGLDGTIERVGPRRVILNFEQLGDKDYVISHYGIDPTARRLVTYVGDAVTTLAHPPRLLTPRPVCR